MFTERKAAQMAAYFLGKHDGRMNHMKLIKLMYLADRQHYSDYGFPISDDCIVAMKQGPVLSQTLDLVNGSFGDSPYWSGLISARENYEVALCRTVTETDSGDLSKGAEKAMDAVDGDFGSWDKWAIVNHTHSLPEWKKNFPGYGAAHIPPADILEAVGKTPEETKAYLHYMNEDLKLATAFSSMCC
jgi:uncharacterized phage-associated protein